MRLIIVSQHFYPDSFRVNDIAFALCEQGHAVRVITGLPDYDAGTVPPAYRRFRKRRETVRGVEVVRLPTTRRRSGAFWRLINYVSFAVAGWLYACFMRRGESVDGVLSYQTSPVSQALPAIRLARRFRCPHLLYCLDLWPESMKVWGLDERSAIYRAVSRVSGRIYRAADLLAVCSRPFERYLTEAHGVCPARLRYLPQHCEALFDVVAGQYEENGVIDFLFAGNVGTAQDVPCILRATAILRDTLASQGENIYHHSIESGQPKDSKGRPESPLVVPAGTKYLLQETSQREISLPAGSDQGFAVALDLRSASAIDCAKASDFTQPAPEVGFHVHIVGGGSELDAMRALCAELGLEARVTFHGRQPLERMPEYYRLADAFLLTLAGGTFVGQTLPGKLQSYMSAGKPVVAAVDGAAAELLAEAGCGWRATASDAEGLARCMAEAMADAPQARALGERGRAYYLKHFCGEVFMKRLMELIREARKFKHTASR